MSSDELLLPCLVLFVVEQPAQVVVAQVVLQVVDAREHVRAVGGLFRRFIEITKQQADELAADDRRRLHFGHPALVVAAHRRGSGTEGLVVKVGGDRLHIGVGIPHELVRDVVAQAVHAPVVAALHVQARGTEAGILADAFLDVIERRALAAGQLVEVPQPHAVVIVEAHRLALLRPQLAQFVEAVAPADEAHRELHIHIRLQREVRRLAVLIVGQQADHFAWMLFR
jgi:hypothetical protein